MVNTSQLFNVVKSYFVCFQGIRGCVGRGGGGGEDYLVCMATWTVEKKVI
jgi:hypothetical protein